MQMTNPTPHNMDGQEQWRPVPGYEENYEVSDQGNVRSLERTVVDSIGHTNFVRARVLKSAIGSAGYPRVSLCRDRKCKTHSVHALVAAAFLGPRPEGLYALHGSADRTDNRACNLRYGTPTENAADKLRDGTHKRGESSQRNKVNEAQVRLLRRVYAIKNRPNGLIADLADAWGISQGTARNLAMGKSWVWLQEDKTDSQALTA
jgi:hypothetical protein